MQIKKQNLKHILLFALSLFFNNTRIHGSTTDGINARDSHGRTALHRVATLSEDKLLLELIHQGADVNAKTAHDNTPLHLAVQNNQLKNIRILLENNAQVNEVNNEGKTALHIAAETGHVECAQILLEHNALVNKPNNKGKTPLHTAVEQNSIAIAQLLKQYHADFNAQDNEGNTALFLAANKNLNEIALLLLQLGANVNATNLYNQTALHLTAARNNSKLMKAFLTKGADLFVTNHPPRQTALHYAVANDHIDSIQVILNYLNKNFSPDTVKAYLNTQDYKGRTALHYATKREQQEIEELLIGNGADIDIRDNDGQTSLSMVIKHYGSIETGWNRELAAEHDHNLNYFALYMHKENPLFNTTMISNGQTALHLAVRKNNMDLAQQLVQKGALVNAQDNSGKTPLHFAAETQQHDFEEFLIDHGANIKMPDNIGQTPFTIATNHLGPLQEQLDQALATQNDKTLHWLTYYFDLETQHINTLNSNGESALHIAVRTKNKPFIGYLIKRGALNLPDHQSKRPTDIADSTEMKDFIIDLFHQNRHPKNLFENAQEKLYEIQRKDPQILDTIGNTPTGGIKDKVSTYFQNHGLLRLTEKPLKNTE